MVIGSCDDVVPVAVRCAPKAGGSKLQQDLGGTHGRSPEGGRSVAVNRVVTVITFVKSHSPTGAVPSLRRPAECHLPSATLWVSHHSIPMSTMNAAEPITSEDALPAHHHPTTTSSLLIPITSSTNNNNYDPITQSGLILEIFPEEMNAVRPEQLSQVLRDESSPIQTWCAASLLYIQLKKEREGCELLNGAVDDTDGDVMMGSNTADKLRLLASAGISALALANRLIASGTREEELRTVADARFTKADNINQVYPPTWIGRGMLNLALGRVDQARFFFEQLTLRECGEILPALLGMAAVKFAEKDYAGAQTLYGRAIQKFKCGAAVRVGFGLASYKLGQIDRAKAAFQRAVDIDPENVEASLALAILEMASLDMTVQDGREYRSKAEKVMKMISTANMIDPSNGMVQNHLANHYFWKWSPVPGVNVSVERGSSVVKGSGIGNAVEAGDRVRIGDFETSIVGEEEGDIDEEIVKIKDAWKGASACKWFHLLILYVP